MTITHIMGEPGRLWVASDTNPEQTHLVDILENQCGCPDYVCRRRQWEQAHPDKKYRCKHLIAAREFFLDEVLESIRQYALSK